MISYDGEQSQSYTPDPRGVPVLANKPDVVGTLRPWSLQSSLPVYCPIDRDHGVQGLPRPRGVRVLHLSTSLDKGTPGEPDACSDVPGFSTSHVCFAATWSRIAARMKTFEFSDPKDAVFCNFNRLDKETAAFVLWCAVVGASGPICTSIICTRNYF